MDQKSSNPSGQKNEVVLEPIDIKVENEPTLVVSNFQKNSNPVANANEPTLGVLFEGGTQGGQEVPTITTLLQRKKFVVKSPQQSEFVSEPKTEQAVSAPMAEGMTKSSPDVSPDLSGEIQATPTATLEIPPTSHEPVTNPGIRRRTARVVIQSENEPATTRKKTSAASSGTGKILVSPPPFNGILRLESLSLKELQKNLKKNKKIPSMRKLDFLGYFSTRFSEIAYFHIVDALADQRQGIGPLKGVLGFGHPILVSNVTQKQLNADEFPFIFECLKKDDLFCGQAEKVNAQEQKMIADLGFQNFKTIGFFPMYYKKKIFGVWITSSLHFIQIDNKELKTLKKILNDLQFES